MRVAVIGGTGYVGPAIVAAMREEGHHVEALSRRTGFDINDPSSIKLDGYDAVAHLVSIRRGKEQDFQRTAEGARNVVDAAKKAGVKRFLLMSANGCDSGSTPYYRAKLAMEDAVKKSGLKWTIFRPSYVSGSEVGGFDEEFSRIVDKAPILPSFNGGRFEIQPISKRDVARALARALQTPASENKTYVLVGHERFTWNEYLRRLAKIRGKKRPLAYAPGGIVIGVAAILGRAFPASPDELRMLMEGSVGDPQPAIRDFGLELESWEDAVQGLRRLR